MFRSIEDTSVDDVVKECGNDCNYMIISKFYREEIATQLKKEMDPEYNIAVMHHYAYDILYGSNLYAWKKN